ncbi:BON1-associated protein [Actinidia chinensis var. chinensis]|uniref:BON1-associated protein n=1 Tax=Actinidia chinensis var. chinensis TaxID=1590841 RepID=A0A2R6RCN8_ACTCC|nr:BON1-associated protein [Actinidia chinensis var. chinensis]
MERETHLLEINLISAQGLKTPSANLRRFQTYAIAWVDSSAKLRTRLDRLGGENPTWNEKFLFRVTSEFLAGETSAVSFEIYAVGYIKDPLVGTVRFLLSSAASRPGIGTPSFTAVQVRRPSGRFHGVLNIAATVLHGLDFASLGGFSAICIRDLMDETHRRRRRHCRRGSEKSEQSSGYESCGDSVDLSDGADSTTSSSSTTSTVLKDWNSERGEKYLKSDGKALLCGLMLQRKIHLRPSDQNLPPSQQEKENRSTIEID